MSTTLRDAWRNARGEWAANRRLRWGVVAIGVIVAVWLALVVRDWREGLEREYATRTERLYKMKALAGQEEWLQRAQATAGVRAALEAQLPQADTPGLAQAAVQGWARQAADAMGGDVRIQSRDATPVEGHPGLWQVPITLAGPFEPRRYLELLRRIEDRETLVVVTEASVLNRANKNFSITVVSYFRIPEAANAGA